jgi:hypothetical protein
MASFDESQNSCAEKHLRLLSVGAAGHHRNRQSRQLKGTRGLAQLGEANSTFAPGAVGRTVQFFHIPVLEFPGLGARSGHPSETIVA